MNTKRFVIGVLAGVVTLHALGYLIFEVLFGAFYAANMGAATGVSREPMLRWAIALGDFSAAVLYTLVIGWARAASIAQGFRIGATVGFLMWLSVDLIIYGSTNVANLTRTLVDPLLEIVHGGIAGAVIAAVMTRCAPSGSQPSS